MYLLVFPIVWRSRKYHSILVLGQIIWESQKGIPPIPFTRVPFSVQGITTFVCVHGRQKDKYVKKKKKREEKPIRGISKLEEKGISQQENDNTTEKNGEAEGNANTVKFRVLRVSIINSFITVTEMLLH